MWGTEAAWGYRQGGCGARRTRPRGYRAPWYGIPGAAAVALGHQLETRPDPGEAQALHPAAGSEAHPQNPGAQRLQSVGPEVEQSGCDPGLGVGGWRLSVGLGWPRTTKGAVGAMEGVGVVGGALEEPQGTVSDLSHSTPTPAGPGPSFQAGNHTLCLEGQETPGGRKGLWTAAKKETIPKALGAREPHPLPCCSGPFPRPPSPASPAGWSSLDSRRCGHGEGRGWWLNLSHLDHPRGCSLQRGTSQPPHHPHWERECDSAGPGLGSPLPCHSWAPPSLSSPTAGGVGERLPNTHPQGAAAAPAGMGRAAAFPGHLLPHFGSHRPVGTGRGP